MEPSRRLVLRSLHRLAPWALALLAACPSAEPPVGPEVVSPAAEVQPSVPPQRHEVVVDGHPITVWGKAPAEPSGVVVLLHGRTWSARPNFDLQVPGEARSLMDAIVAEGLAVYAVDQRGYGATPRDASEFLTPERATADLAAVLGWVRQQHPQLAPPVLLGWSLGSLVSQLCAQAHPERLSALVLYGYPRRPGQVYPPDPDPAAPPLRKPTTAEGAAEDFISPGTISAAAIDAYVRAAVAADPVKMDWRGSEQWNALDPTAVRVPTLVIHGERDPYAPVEAQAELFARLGHPDRTWVILPGCDHAAHLETCGPRFVQEVVALARRAR